MVCITFQSVVFILGRLFSLGSLMTNNDYRQKTQKYISLCVGSHFHIFNINSDFSVGQAFFTDQSAADLGNPSPGETTLLHIFYIRPVNNEVSGSY